MVEGRTALDRFLERVNLVMVWIGAAMVIFMMLAISYSSIMRYIGKPPGAWIVEISSYLMLYITFLGTAWLQRHDGHVEVDLFLCNLKPRTSAGFKAVTSLAGALVGFVLAWKGSLVTIDYYQRGVTLMSILEHPSISPHRNHSDWWCASADRIHTAYVAPGHDCAGENENCSLSRRM